MSNKNEINSNINKLMNPDTNEFKKNISLLTYRNKNELSPVSISLNKNVLDSLKKANKSHNQQTTLYTNQNYNKFLKTFKSSDNIHKKKLTHLKGLINLKSAGNLEKIPSPTKNINTSNANANKNHYRNKSELKIVKPKNNNNNFYTTETIFSPKKSPKINMKSFSNSPENDKKELINENIYEYHPIIKSLDKWDKDHCEEYKENMLSLYTKLSNYYIENNLKEDKKHLDTTNNIIKSRNNINYFFDNFNRKNIKVISNLLYKKNNNPIDSNLHINFQKKIYNDNYISEISKMTMKYENQCYKDLIFVNSIIVDKMSEKIEKTKEYEKICEKQTILQLKYKEKCSEKTKLFYLKLDEYDQGYKNLIKSEKEFEKKHRKSKMIGSQQYHKKISKIYSDIEFIKNIKLYSMNNEFEKKKVNIQTEYNSKNKELNNEKKRLKNKIKILNIELLYYRIVNEQLLKECRIYYLEILKKGKDIRKDGLVWVVKNLLELQVNLEYQNFPKYLNKKQIDYLIELGKIILEENELRVIVKVLHQKKKHEKLNEVMKGLDLLESMDDEGNNQKDKILLFSYSNNFCINNNNDTKSKENEEYDLDYIAAKHYIDKKFFNIYKNNKEILNNRIDKISEEIKIQTITEKIRRGIYNSFLKERELYNDGNKKKTGILETFMGNTQNKDFYDVIIEIKNRLNTLQKIKEDMYEDIKENYLCQVKYLQMQSEDNWKIKDKIKKALFGAKPVI